MPKKNMVERADVAIAESAASARHHPVTKLAGAIGEIADQPQMIAICSAVMGIGLLAKNPRLARTGGRMLAAELVATLIKSAIKHRVVRTRPHVIDDGGDYRMKGGKDRSSEMSSFPSGHTAGAVAVALAITREYPEAKVGAFGGGGGNRGDPDPALQALRVGHRRRRSGRRGRSRTCVCGGGFRGQVDR